MSRHADPPRVRSSPKMSMTPRMMPASAKPLPPSWPSESLMRRRAAMPNTTARIPSGSLPTTTSESSPTASEAIAVREGGSGAESGWSGAGEGSWLTSAPQTAQKRGAAPPRGSMMRPHLLQVRDSAAITNCHLGSSHTSRHCTSAAWPRVVRGVVDVAARPVRALKAVHADASRPNGCRRAGELDTVPAMHSTRGAG